MYFDDDSEGRVVCRALAAEGHDTLTATDSGLRGARDEDHLRFAISQGRAVVTANRGGFFGLHTAYLRAGRHHAGVIIVLQQHYSPGEQLRRFRRLLSSRSAEEMVDRLEWLSDWGSGPES